MRSYCKPGLVAGIALLLTGCAAVRIETKAWTFTGASLFKSVEIPRLTMSPAGGLSVRYSGDVDGEALGDAARAGLSIR